MESMECHKLTLEALHFEEDLQSCEASWDSRNPEEQVRSIGHLRTKLSSRQAILANLEAKLRAEETRHRRSVAVKEESDRELESTRRSLVRAQLLVHILGASIENSEDEELIGRLAELKKGGLVIEKAERTFHLSRLLDENRAIDLRWFRSKVELQENVLDNHQVRLQLLVQRSPLSVERSSPNE